MTFVEFLSSLLPIQTLGFLKLFSDAHPVVKAVIVSLILASLISWAIIIEKLIVITHIRRSSERFLQAFKSSPRREAFALKLPPRSAAARLYASGIGEWQANAEIKSPPGVLQTRIERILSLRLQEEVAGLESGLPFLATVGSASPFIGLFGTVWGIMTSFRAIADAKNTSLAIVAPGIAEALFATALGLLAAIPAVIAYNKLSNDVNRTASRLEAFVIEFLTRLSRRIETDASGSVER